MTHILLQLFLGAGSVNMPAAFLGCSSEPLWPGVIGAVLSQNHWGLGAGLGDTQVLQGGAGETGCCSVDVEFQFCKLKKF